MDQDKIQQYRDEQKRKQERNEELSAIKDVRKAVVFDGIRQRKAKQPVEVTNPGASSEDIAELTKSVVGELAKLNTKVQNLPKDYHAFEMPKIPTPPDEVSVKNISEVTDWLKKVVDGLGKIKLDPKIEVKAPKIPDIKLPKIPAPIITVPQVDLEPVIKAIEKLETPDIKIPDNKEQFKKLQTAITAITTAINSLSFPVPNYVLPYSQGGKASQVALTSAGKVPVEATFAGTIETEPVFSTSADVDKKALVDADRHLQVDVLTMPTTTVTATDLDIRNLVFATDKVDASGTTLGANSGVDVGDVTINNAAGASAVNIQDGGNSITVDGAVTATVASTTITGTVAVTQSGTWDEVGINDSGNSITVDNSTLAVVGGGTEATAMRVTLANDSTGLVSVDDNGASLSVDWNGTQPVTGSGTATGALRVELPTNGTGVVGLNTGSNVIGALTANQSVNTAQINGVTTQMGVGASGTGTQRVVTATDSTIGTVTSVTAVALNSDIRQGTASNLNAQVVGTVAHDGVDAGNPLKVGGKARQTNPTAVADLDRVDATFDDIGRQVVVLNQVRDLEVHQTTTIAASTAETTILTAGAAGVFHDITLITIANTSATATRVDIRDATAGSVIWSMYVPAGQQIGANITVPIKQTTAANNWTATCITSLTDLRIFVQGVKNV